MFMKGVTNSVGRARIRTARKTRDLKVLVLISAAYNAYSNNAYNVLELPNPTWFMKAVC